MRILLDIDDTLADFFGALEERLGPAVDDSIENLGLMFPGNELVRYLESDDFHREMLPLDGAVQGVNWLFDAGHHSQYLTARAPELQQLTQEWLDEWGFPKAVLHSVGRDAKKKLLRTERYELMIDDQKRYLRVAHKHGKRTIAMDRPWNANWGGTKLKNWMYIESALQGQL